MLHIIPTHNPSWEQLTHYVPPPRTQGTAMTTPTDPFSRLHSFNKLLLNISSMVCMLGTNWAGKEVQLGERVHENESVPAPGLLYTSPILLHGLILPHWRDCVGSWPWDFYGNIILSPSGPAESTALVVCLIHASLAPRKSCMVYLYIQPPSGVTRLFHSSIGNHLQSFQCIKHICLASTSWSLLSCERWARAVSPSIGVLLEACSPKVRSYNMTVIGVILGLGPDLQGENLNFPQILGNSCAQCNSRSF